MKNDRLFRLLYLLLEKGSLSAPALAELLEVSVRTVYRDVDSLAQSGVPVYTTQGRGGGVSLMPGYSIQKALLSEEEQNEMLFALQSLRAADRDTEALLTKLGSVFGRTPQSWIEVDFSRWGCGRSDRAKFEALKEALLKKQVLSIDYAGAAGKSTSRRIKPVRLIFKGAGWYLQAYCLKADDYRLFKVNRITGYTLTDAFFFDDFCDAPPVELESPLPPQGLKLTLRFLPQTAYRLCEEFDPEALSPQPDGSVIARVDFPEDSWLYGFLLSYGTGVQILEPAAFRQRFADYTKLIFHHHKT